MCPGRGWSVLESHLGGGRAGRSGKMTPTERFHEDYGRAEDVVPSSDRSFGLIFTGFFALVGLAPLLRGSSPRTGALALGAGILIVTLLRPGWLAPLNRLWTGLGLLLHHVMNPVVLGLLFFGAITPMGWVMRRLRQDPLGLSFDPEAVTYWIERQPPGPAPETMSNQF